MALTDELINDPRAGSAYKVQIFAQAVVLQKRTSPKMERQMTEFGVEIQTHNWYDEYQCKQLACNFNALYLSEKDFEKYWNELGKAVKSSMAEKGLFK